MVKRKILLFVAIVCLFFYISIAKSENYYPKSFDSLGSTVKSLIINEKVINYIDDGKKTNTPVVFISGVGTSVRASRLLDFLRSFREELGLRLISIERNGFGQTLFNPLNNMATYSQDILDILDHLDIDSFSLFGISGGGPYAAKLASIAPERIESIHMAATLPVLGTRERCNDGQIYNIYKDIFKYPMKYFSFPNDSPIHMIDGFQDTAYDDASRTFYINGQMADVSPLDHELTLYCDEGVIDTNSIKAPLYIYAGLSDPLLSNNDINDWSIYYPNSDVIKRVYPGEGHDVQYRHLDQILIDIKFKGNKVLICNNDQEQLINSSDLKISNNYHYGLCIWGNSYN